MKNITIAGRVGKEAVPRRTQNGDAVLSWSVAVDDGWGDKKTTLWFDCSLWGKRGEKLASMLTKGTPVTVSGDLGQRTHEGKTYLTIRVNEVTLHGGKPKEQPSQEKTDYVRNGSAALDDEIPF